MVGSVGILAGGFGLSLYAARWGTSLASVATAITATTNATTDTTAAAVTAVTNATTATTLWPTEVALAAGAVPLSPSIRCIDRADVATYTEALCVASPFSAAVVSAVVAGIGKGKGEGHAELPPPDVTCAAYDGSPLPPAKADCRALFGESAAAAWFPLPSPPLQQRATAGASANGVRASTRELSMTPPPLGPPSVLLRLTARDINIAHATMKILALHHVLRHPGRYGLPPAPVVVVHLGDRYVAPIMTKDSSWGAGLLSSVLSASPTGGVTITNDLASTPTTYAVAAVVGGWSNRFSVGNRHGRRRDDLNRLARADHAALYAVLPLPPGVRERAATAASAAAPPVATAPTVAAPSPAVVAATALQAVPGSLTTSPAYLGLPSPSPPPLRVVYLSRRLNHRRRFDEASEKRLIDTLTAVAAAAGVVVTVMPTVMGGSLAAQVAAVAGADVVVGVHGAALTTAVVAAWGPHPPDDDDDSSSGDGGDDDDDRGGTLVELWPYGFRLPLFETVTSGAAVVYTPVALSSHGVDYPGRRRRRRRRRLPSGREGAPEVANNDTSAGAGGDMDTNDGEDEWAETPAACTARDPACFVWYRDATQVFGTDAVTVTDGAGRDPPDVAALREAVAAGLRRAAAWRMHGGRLQAAAAAAGSVAGRKPSTVVAASPGNAGVTPSPPPVAGGVAVTAHLS
ncbi:hypothetical protein MMPV_001705 [Pyropia vietnamensis]